MTTARHLLLRDGLALRVDDAGGAGVPVVFQHGLGGDSRQTAEAFPPEISLRRITLECRGHGGSEAGDELAFSLARFADDVAALIEAERIAPAVVGGISMGAAIATRLAVRRPDLVRGLIIARPAWLTEAAPANMQPNAEVGRLLATLPAEAARAAFDASDIAAVLARDAPDNLASLHGFFARAPIPVTAALLGRISADGPGITEAELRALTIPTLVIGHDRDLVHPFVYAEMLAALIPGAQLLKITPKATDKARYVAEFRAGLGAFLKGFS